jgi:hypothetical protein
MFAAQRSEANMARDQKKERPVFEPLVCDVRAAEALLDEGKDRIYALIRSGELESYLDGGSRKISVSSIKARVARKLAAAKNKFERGRHPGQKRPPDDSPSPS